MWIESLSPIHKENVPESPCSMGISKCFNGAHLIRDSKCHFFSKNLSSAATIKLASCKNDKTSTDQPTSNTLASSLLTAPAIPLTSFPCNPKAILPLSLLLCRLTLTLIGLLIIREVIQLFDRHNGAVIQPSTLWLTWGFRGHRWGHLPRLGQWAMGGKVEAN